MDTALETMRPLFLLFGLTVLASAEKPDRMNHLISSLAENIPQVIFGGEWTTTVVLMNTNGSPVEVEISFWNGADGQALAVPVEGVSGRASKHKVTIPANGLSQLNISDRTTNTATLAWGKADIPCSLSATCGGVAGEVILRNSNPTRPDFESTYRLVDDGRHLIMLYDQRDFFQTVAVVVETGFLSFNNNPVAVTLAFRDEAGQRIHLDQFDMRPRTMRLINFAAAYPQTVNRRGTMEVSTAQGYLVLSGIRINPTNAFTALESFEP